MGHSILNSAHYLDIYTIILLVDSHVCGQRNSSMFPKRPREQVLLLFSFESVILVSYWKMAALLFVETGCNIALASHLYLLLPPTVPPPPACFGLCFLRQGVCVTLAVPDLAL